MPYAVELASIHSLGAAVASSGDHRLQRQRLLIAVPADRDRHLFRGGQTELNADQVIGVGFSEGVLMELLSTASGA